MFVQMEDIVPMVGVACHSVPSWMDLPYPKRYVYTCTVFMHILAPYFSTIVHMMLSRFIAVWSCTMKGKLVSLEHSNNFNRTQDVLIRRSSSVVVQEWIKRNLLECVCQLLYYS